MNIHKYILGFLLALVPLTSSAWCTWCLVEGACVDVDASCQEVMAKGFGICFTGGALAASPGNSLQSANGQLWRVDATSKVPFASDKTLKLIAELQQKYAGAKASDPKVNAQLKTEWSGIEKSLTEGTVSLERIHQFARETKLPIYVGEDRQQIQAKVVRQAK